MSLRTLDRNGLDRKRLGLSQTRQGDDSGGERRREKQVALFSCSVEESSRVTEVLCGDKQQPGMEDFGRDRGEGRVSGKSWDWVKTLDVAEVKVGCPGKVLNRDERRVIKGVIFLLYFHLLFIRIVKLLHILFVVTTRECDDSVAIKWLNNEAVRKAIHADPISKAGKWEICTGRVKYNSELITVIDYHKKLTAGGYRALIYRYTHL
uniref:Uncharacterized protein n=1 Tax=Lactuca sativa TaxID=4236 RepID=A0A9R1VBE5_LACSA|nr:hypothetical protein LSAT_V11C500293630 [Lactuca sativa]